LIQFLRFPSLLSLIRNKYKKDMSHRVKGDFFVKHIEFFCLTHRHIGHIVFLKSNKTYVFYVPMC
jgi:hypothetical protein